MTGRVKYILAFWAVALLGCLAMDAYGQHYVGVRGGLGGGSDGRTFPKSRSGWGGAIETATLWGLYHGGVSWKYYTKEKYAGGTEVDILFMQQGFKEIGKPYSFNGTSFDGTTAGADTTAYYSRKINSIMVPLMWQPHIYMFNRNLRVFLNAGVTFSYNISSTYTHGSSDREEIYVENKKYPMKTIRDNRFGYGLVAGGGLGYSFGRLEFVAEVRYYIGYSDFKKNWNKYYDNSNHETDVTQRPVTNRLRTPLDGLQGSVAFYYRLGKGGILSPPTPKVEQRLREIEEKRLRKKGLLPMPGEEDMENELGIVDDEGNIIWTEPLEVIPDTEEIPLAEPAPETLPESSQGSSETDGSENTDED